MSADTGEYNFIVRSPRGLAEGSFFVNMTYASGYNGPQVVVLEPVSNANIPHLVLTTIYLNVILSLLCY